MCCSSRPLPFTWQSESDNNSDLLIYALGIGPGTATIHFHSRTLKTNDWRLGKRIPDCQGFFVTLSDIPKGRKGA